MPASRCATRRESHFALGVSFAFVAALVIDAYVRGALGVARNDDWSYLRTTFDLVDTHHFHLNGWATTSLVGQVAMALPIAALTNHSIVALQLFTAALGALTLWTWYLVLRRLLPPLHAVVACSGLALGPIFGSVAVSFMTDVPALFMQTLTLYLGIRAFENPVRRHWWLVASAGVGLWAFSIREFAIAAVAAVLLAHLWDARKTRARVIAVLSIAAAFALAASVVWLTRHNLPFDKTIPYMRHSYRQVVQGICQIVLTTAFFLLPITLLVAPRRLFSSAYRSSRALTVGAIVALPLSVRFTPASVLLGNYFDRDGSYSETVAGSNLPKISAIVWGLAVVAAAWSLLVVLLTAFPPATRAAQTIWRREGLRASPSPESSVDMVLGLYVVASLALFVVIMSRSAWFFDRYVITVSPALSGLVLAWALRRKVVVSSPRRLFATVAFAAYAVVGLGFVDASATFDGGRWKLAEDAVGRGASPAAVDGGLDWVGFHHAGVAVYDPRVGRTWWASLYSDPVCQTVTAGSSADATDEFQATTLLGQLTLSLRPGPDHCAARSLSRG